MTWVGADLDPSLPSLRGVLKGCPLEADVLFETPNEQMVGRRFSVGGVMDLQRKIQEEKRSTHRHNKNEQFMAIIQLFWVN